MKYKQYLIESSGKWGYPTSSDMKSDYAEYEKKLHSKWEGRANQIGAKFPLFTDYQDFVNQIKKSQVITLTSALEKQIPATSYCETIECIEDMVGGYKRPRDVKRIVSGFQKGNTIPYPIILKGKRGYFRLAGNTRMNVARVLGIPVKILIIDVSE